MSDFLKQALAESGLAGTVGSDTSSFLDQALIDSGLKEAPIRSRNIAAVANDTVIETANAALGGVKTISDFVSPGNRFSNGIEDLIKEGQDSQSNAVKAGKAKLNKAMDSDDTMTQLRGVKDYILENPLQAAAQAVGTFVTPGVAIKGAKLAGGALNLGEKAAGRLGLGVGAGTSAAMSGGDAAGSAYDLVYNSSATQGMSPEERDALATRAARQASIVPAIVGGVGGMFGADKALALGTKSILKTGLQEFASEAFEEGATQLSANLAARQYAPEVNAMQGVVGSAALGGVLGGGTGLAVGALTKQPINTGSSLLAGGNEANTQTTDIANAINIHGAPELSTQEIINQAAGVVERTKKEQAAQLAQRQADMNAAMNEPSGVRVNDPLTGHERELTQGELATHQANQVAGQNQAAVQQQQEAELLAKHQSDHDSRVAVATKYGGVKVIQEGTEQNPHEGHWQFLGEDFFNVGDLQKKIASIQKIEDTKDPLTLKVEEALQSAGSPLKPGALRTMAAKYAATSIEKVAYNLNAKLESLAAAGKGVTDNEVTRLGMAYESLTGQVASGYSKAESNVDKKAKGTNGQQKQAGATGSATTTASGQTGSGSTSALVAAPGGGTASVSGNQVANVKRSTQVSRATPIEAEKLKRDWELATGNKGDALENLTGGLLDIALRASKEGKLDAVMAQGIQELNAPDDVTHHSTLTDAVNHMIQQEGSMSTEDLPKVRNLFEHILGTDAKDRLMTAKELAEEFGLTEDQAKNWSKHAKAILDGNEKDPYVKKFEAAKLFVADQHGFQAWDEMQNSMEHSRSINRQQSSAASLAKDEYATEVFNQNNTIDEKELQNVEEGEATSVGITSKKSVNSKTENFNFGEAVTVKWEELQAQLNKANEDGDMELVDKLEGEMSALLDKTDKNNKKAAKQNQSRPDAAPKKTVGDKLKDKAAAKKAEPKKTVSQKLKEKMTVKWEADKEAPTVTKEEAPKIWDKLAAQINVPLFNTLSAKAQDEWIDHVKTGNDKVKDMLVLLNRNKVQYSTGTQKTSGQNADKLAESLKKFFHAGNSFNRLVTVVDSVNALPDAILSRVNSVEADKVQAFVHDKHVYLVADNIKKGTELGVMLHELGVHLGMKNLVGVANYDKLVDQVDVWLNAKDGSLEHEIATKAWDRVKAAEKAQGKMSLQESQDEFLAYFVEEAVVAGVKPAGGALKNSSPIIQFLRTVLAHMKVALRKIGFGNFDSLTAGDMVNLAFGAAKLELDGTYHNTNSSFRTFLDEKVSDIINGWGHYSAGSKFDAHAFGFNRMRTLPLVDKEMLLELDEFLENQPKVLKAIEKRLPAKAIGDRKLDQLTGRRLQSLLKEFEGNTGELNNALPKGLKDNLFSVDEIVSKYMETVLGLPGITYKSPFGNEPHVITFSGSNLKRVSSTDEKTGNVQFSLASTIEDLHKLKDKAPAYIDKLPHQLQPAVSAIHTAMFGAKKIGLGFTLTEDVAEMAKKYMPSVDKFVAAFHEKASLIRQQEEHIQKIMGEADKLDDATRVKLNDVLAKMTISNTWGYDPKLKDDLGQAVNVAVNPDMVIKFNALPAAAQKVVKDVFASGRETLNLKKSVVYDMINSVHEDKLASAGTSQAEIKKAEKEKAAMLKQFSTILKLDPNTPYAPLKRFGNFVVTAKSQTYMDAEKNGNTQWLTEHESDEDHRIVEFAQTMGEALAIQKQLIALNKFQSVEKPFEKSNSTLYKGADLYKGFAKLRRVLEHETDDSLSEKDRKIAGQLKAMVNDLYLVSLANSSARKSEMERKKIAGFNRDMLRAFYTQGMADAHYLANLQTSDKILDAMVAMREEAKPHRADAYPFLNELMAHESDSLEIRPPSMFDGINRLTGDMFLTFSPGFYLQQATQTYVLSLPHLAGKYGYFKSARMLNAAYKDIFPLLKNSNLKEHLDLSKVPADVAEMLKVLVHEGKIDIGIETEAYGNRSEKGSNLNPVNSYKKVTNLLRGAINRVETINRSTAAITAYRLEMQNSGKKADAIEAARKVVHITHGSYDGFNTPRYMGKNAFTRSVTQFRRFQIIQLSMLAREFHAMLGKDASPIERKIAAKQFGFLFAHTAVLAGAKGVPLYALASVVYMLCKAIGGDDEDPEDLEAYLREHGGLWLTKGIPAAMGLDLSNKLGMGNTFSILPYTDIDLTSKSGMEKTLIGLSGPFFGGLLPKMADGVGLMAGGQIHKGMEQVVPKGIADGLKAVRFATDGVTMRNGDHVLSPDEIGFADIVAQGLGLPTTKITERQYLQGELIKYEKFYKERTTEVKHDYVEAYRSGDKTAIAEARAEWDALQASRIKNGFTRQPLSDLLKAPMAQIKREKLVIGGVAAKRSNKGFLKQRAEE